MLEMIGTLTSFLSHQAHQGRGGQELCFVESKLEGTFSFFAFYGEIKLVCPLSLFLELAIPRSLLRGDHFHSPFEKGG